MALVVVAVFCLCFVTALIQVAFEGRRRAPVTRTTAVIGAVTCEVIAFEDFELIKTSEHVLQAAGW